MTAMRSEKGLILTPQHFWAEALKEEILRPLIQSLKNVGKVTFNMKVCPEIRNKHCRFCLIMSEEDNNNNNNYNRLRAPSCLARIRL